MKPPGRDEEPLELDVPEPQQPKEKPAAGSRPAYRPPAPPRPRVAPAPASRVSPWVVASVAVVVAVIAAVVLAARARKSEVVADPAASASDYATVALEVASTPPGAAISLDGKATGQQTPAKLTLETGREHLVELSHPDCFPYRAAHFAAPHQPIKIDAALKVGGHLAATSDPPGATIEIDGKSAFPAPGRSGPLEAGKHVVVATGVPGRAVEVAEITVAGTETVEWAAKLAPGVPYLVSSEPPGAAVFLDDKPVGLKTPAELSVAAGKKHVIRVELAGHNPAVHATPALPTTSTVRPISITLTNVKVAGLRAEAAKLEKLVRASEKRLATLRARQAGPVLVTNVRKEQALVKEIEELEVDLERQQTDLSNLQDEIARAAAAVP